MIKNRISSGDHLFGRELGTVVAVEMKKSVLDSIAHRGHTSLLQNRQLWTAA